MAGGQTRTCDCDCRFTEEVGIPWSKSMTAIVNKSTTFAKIKQAVAALKKIPIDQLRVLVQGREMDSETLSSVSRLESRPLFLP